MTTVSALIVTHNQAPLLEDCLKSVSFVDEIVIVLDKCTDASKSIAERYTKHIIEGAWELEGDRRNLGIQACSSTWILEIDTDERVSASLAVEIKSAIASCKTPAYFLIPFDNYIGNTLVKCGWGCSWGVGSAVRLFSKGAKIWGAQLVHPKLALHGEKKILSHAITHYAFKDITDMIQKFNTYTSKRALDLMQQNVEDTLAHNIRRFFSRFYKCYCRRKGYKEGSYGLLNAIFAGLFPLVSFLKAKELMRRIP